MSSIKVPPLGESIVEATVSRWLKKEGDAVAVGDSLVELETDKITVEVPALEAGTLTSRAKGEGDVVAVGDVLGEIAAGAAGAGAATAAAAPAAAVAAAPAAGSAGAGQAAGTDPKVSPAAAR
ncbi:MAG: biotin/lipoyl-containing protein, partial [Gemmatimonas sp.]